MTDTHSHDSAAHGPELFHAAEWREFRESDKQAAKAIVVLMMTIFVTGIVLYSIVAATL